MRKYLSNYINTLSANRSEKVSNIVEEARVGKNQIETIVNRLKNDFTGFDSVNLRKETPSSRLLANNLLLNLRDASLRVQDLYEASNLISLLLASHAEVLSSQVASIEEEINAMDKMVNNFAFLLSDNQAFDFAHLESFVDDRGRSTDDGFFTDRTGNNFTEDTKAALRPEEGAISLPDGIQNGHGIIPTIVRTNVGGYVETDSGIGNCVRAGSDTGWKQEIVTPSPVTTSFVSGVRGGAQVEIEFTLTQPSSSSEIKLVPFADIPMDLYRVKIFNSETDQTGRTVLNEPIKLDRAFSVQFETQTVQRFTIVVNQSTFDKRSRSGSFKKESDYRTSVTDLIKRNKEERRSNQHRRSFHIRRLERAIQSKTLNTSVADNFYSVDLPLTDAEPDVGPMDPAVLALNRIHERSETWRTSEPYFNRIIKEVLQQDGSFDQITRGRASFSSESLSNSQTDTVYHPHLVFEEDANVNRENRYVYTVGLRYVSIGINNPKYKGVFVSKPLPSQGDIGEIRLRAEAEEYFLDNTDRDLKQVTTIEYSVSNKYSPDSEEDWIPILPINTEQVSGERIFPLSNGVAYFRFPAQDSMVYTLYRNGYEVDEFTEIRGAPGELLGFKINDSIYGPDNIYTCDYYPVGDATTINFEPYGFDDLPLVSAFDETGVGERFLATAGGNIASLSNLPFVDPGLSQTDPTYSPVTVVLEDGTTVTNLTDYKNNNTFSPPSDIGYYYYHSGRILTFNEKIDRPFRVYYEYLQNNVRFRVVLRCNMRDFASPKVSSVHLKAKTRKPDRRRL